MMKGFDSNNCGGLGAKKLLLVVSRQKYVSQHCIAYNRLVIRERPLHHMIIIISSFFINARLVALWQQSVVTAAMNVAVWDDYR